MADTIVISKLTNGNILVNNDSKESTVPPTYVCEKDVEQDAVLLFDHTGAQKNRFTVTDVEKVIHSDTTEVVISDLDTLFTELITFFFFKLEGGTGTGWQGQVEFRADLPVTVGTPVIGTVYLVEKPTTILFGLYEPTSSKSGLYLREANAGALSDWRRLNIKVKFTDGEFRIVGVGDESKQAKFDLSLLTTSTTRNYTLQDRDHVVAGVDDRGIEAFFLDAVGAFGTGGGWADSGFIGNFPVLFFAQNLTERAVFMFYAIARVFLDQVDPQVAFITYSSSTAPAVGDEDVVWELQARYRAVGESLIGPADETLQQTQTLTTQVDDSREPNLIFTLDRSLMSDQDVIHLILRRIGGDAADNYSDDAGVGQAGMLVETRKHNP